MSQKIIEYLLQATQNSPDDPFPHFALAKEYHKINDRPSSRKHFQYLIDRFPDYAGTYYHFALFLLEENATSNADQIIRKGLKVLRQQNDTKLYNELASLTMD